MMLPFLLQILFDVTADSRVLQPPITLRSDGRMAFGRHVVGPDRGFAVFQRLYREGTPRFEIEVEDGHDRALFGKIWTFAQKGNPSEIEYSRDEEDRDGRPVVRARLTIQR